MCGTTAFVIEKGMPGFNIGKSVRTLVPAQVRVNDQRAFILDGYVDRDGAFIYTRVSIKTDETFA